MATRTPTSGSAADDTKSATSIAHGFRVLPVAPITDAFKRGLRRLAAKGYVDPSCTIVKTASGPLSGVSHAGGRYVHPANPYAPEVMEQMREQGVDPPTPPFIVAAGAVMLFHEWGHHVDRQWSRDDMTVGFSFRWFSALYEVRIRRNPWAPRTQLGDDQADPIETEDDALKAVVEWGRLASELFANLFEDWMRGDQRVAWDTCEPAHVDNECVSAVHPTRLALLPGVTTREVRGRTYELFEMEQNRAVEPPEVRDDLFGRYTAVALERYRNVMRKLLSMEG